MSSWSATVYVQLERNGICPAGAQWHMSGFCLRISGPVTRDIYSVVFAIQQGQVFLYAEIQIIFEKVGTLKTFLSETIISCLRALKSFLLLQFCLTLTISNFLGFENVIFQTD